MHNQEIVKVTKLFYRLASDNAFCEFLVPGKYSDLLFLESELATVPSLLSYNKVVDSEEMERKPAGLRDLH